MARLGGHRLIACIVFNMAIPKAFGSLWLS